MANVKFIKVFVANESLLADMFIFDSAKELREDRRGERGCVEGGKAGGERR